MIKFLSLFSVLFISLSIFAQSYTVEFKIKNVKNNKGYISAGLYNQADAFPEEDGAFKGKKVKAEKDYVKIKFENLPSGNYALAVLHDENNNEEMDTNIIGIPKEGYCFSQNAKAKFGAPSFDKAKFTVDRDKYFTLFIEY